MPEIILEDPDGTFAMLRDSVAAFAQRFDGAKALRARRSAGRDLDRDIWSAMAEAGWLGLMLPEDLGGAGLGMSEQAIPQRGPWQGADHRAAGAALGIFGRAAGRSGSGVRNVQDWPKG
jgi:alkylation response protein AidB-like acyl-CoA dehydrogenase